MVRLLVSCIQFYQKISRFTARKCRYYPSCSCYAIKALTKYGIFVGGWLTLKRIIRCNFLFNGGIDDI